MLHALPPRRGPHAGRVRRRATRTPTSCSWARRRASTRTSRATRSSARPGSSSTSSRRDRARARADVYIANVLKCRPPGNRDPQPDEIEACEPHLFRQIELIEPKLVATLGNFATKLLSGKPHGITRVHGSAGGDARRPPRDALPALPSGRRALHAGDAADARGGLRPHPGAARRGEDAGRAELLAARAAPARAAAVEQLDLF